MDIWKTILAWGMCKQEELKQRDDGLTERQQGSWRFHILYRNWVNRGNDYKLTILEEETQALELILHWVRRDGMEALERAEYVIDGRRVKPTDIDQHIKQLLELMEREYWSTPYPISPRTADPDMYMSVPLAKEIFRTMLEEMPKLIRMHRRFGLRNPTLEARFSTTFDKILRLSSWTPSTTHNKHLRELLNNVLLMLNNLGNNKEYHNDLRDFMKRHTAFCAFTLDNADVITTEDSETTAKLCKSLRRLARRLRLQRQNNTRSSTKKLLHTKKVYHIG